MPEVGPASSWFAPVPAPMIAHPSAHVQRPRLRRPRARRPARRGNAAGTPLAMPPSAAARLARVRLAVRAVGAALVLTVLFCTTTDLGTRVRAAVPVFPDSDRIVRLAGFGIDQVSLTGHRMTLDREVFDALDLANVRSMLRFDAPAVKARIERLPWVATAELTRVYPGRLEVRVTERKPFAVWTRGERRYLIDETGRVLSPLGGDAAIDLPVVAGEGAAGEAKAVLGLVGTYPELMRRLEAAERVAERRWRLKLSGAVVLDLPAEREAEALAFVAARADLARLVAGENCIVDLRTPGRVTVRAPAETGARTRHPAPSCA